MGKIVKSTKMLREPNGRNPQRLKHRFNERKYLDVIKILGPLKLSGKLYIVSEDRSCYTTHEVVVEGAAELGHWQTNRGILPLPGQGPNSKNRQPLGGEKMPTQDLSGDENKVLEIAKIISSIGGKDERVDALQHRIAQVMEDQKIADSKLSEVFAKLEEVTKHQPTRVEIVKDDRVVEVEGLVHRRFADAAKLTSIDGAGLYLWGPAGTGKTSAAKQIAKALGLRFFFSSRLLEHYALAGFRTANGETVRTEFREAFEHGGLFLLDELDRSDPNAVLWLNAVLANGVCAFPDKTVQQHKDFRIIATGNTQMNGASAMYNGAAKQDASVADRFRFLHWPIDEALEEAAYYANGAQDSAWLDRVRRIRAVVERRKIQSYDVTPRAVFDGLKLLLHGMSEELALEASVQRNCEAVTWNNVLTEAA